MMTIYSSKASCEQARQKVLGSWRGEVGCGVIPRDVMIGTPRCVSYLLWQPDHVFLQLFLLPRCAQS